jgi:nucleotide exchange factor SIL1
VQTGEKQAKLYDPAEDTSNSENLLLDSDLIQVVDSSGQTRKRATQSYTIPPRAWQDKSSQSDQDVFDIALQELLTDLPNADEISNLESLAHDREYGVKLVQLDPLSRLLQIAELADESNIRQCAVRIIGSSLWNNPEAMKAVEGTDLIRRLLELLSTEKDVGVRSSLVFSLSAAAAGEYGIKEFMFSQGSLELRTIFLGGEPEEQRKCATFVEDNLPSNRAIDGVDQELVLWCRVFQEYLQKNAGDATSENVLSSLMSVPRWHD